MKPPRASPPSSLQNNRNSSPDYNAPKHQRKLSSSNNNNNSQYQHANATLSQQSTGLGNHQTQQQNANSNTGSNRKPPPANHGYNQHTGGGPRGIIFRVF